MQNNNEVRYAGFWVRVMAYIMDLIIVFGLTLVVRLILSFSMLCGDSFRNILFQYSLKDIVLYVLQAVYFIITTYYLNGATFGKKAMNIRVVSTDTEKLTFFTVLYRETIGRFLSQIILCIGYFMCGCDEQKRCLHDRICDTRVIYRDSDRPEITKKEEESEPATGEQAKEEKPEEVIPQTWTYYPENKE